MISKEGLHRLVDELPEEKWPAAFRFLEFLCRQESESDVEREEPEPPPGPE